MWFAIVSGGFVGFPTSLSVAEPLAVPGPVVEYPATTSFRLVPVEQTRYARFANEFFAGEGKVYLTDFFGRPLAGGYRILAGRHRITGSREFDLVLMIDPLKRERYAPPEVTALVFKKSGTSWRRETAFSGYGRPGYGFIQALVSPVVGVTYSGEPVADDIDPPFWVPPMRDGRRTIVWNEEGKFWDGSAWKPFCWRRCEERG